MHAYTGYVLSGYEEALVLTGDYGAYTCPVTMAAIATCAAGTRMIWPSGRAAPLD